jgi:zinc protease
MMIRFAPRLLAPRLAAPLLAAALLATPLHAEIDIQPVTSPQGFNAWLVQEPSIPMVAIEVIFLGGAMVEPDDRLGAVALMANLMTEGAGDLDAQGYAAAVESLAASIGFRAGRESVTLSIRTLTETLDQTVDLARLALMQPRFDPDALERLRAQQLAQVQRAQRNPDQIASRAFAARAFAGHPYARPSTGTPDTLAALTRDDVIAAHGAALDRDRVVIGASGDISAVELGALIDRLLGDLPLASAPLPDYAAYALSGGVSVVDHPGPQSVIAFGHAGLQRNDPDFMAAFVLTEFFGGGRFGTRLMTELREARGLTYGIGAGLASGTFGDSFQGRLSTDNSRAAQVIDLLRAEWQWLADGGMTQADLERTQTYLTGAYALRFDGNESIAGILASMQFQDYAIDYVNVRNDLVRAVTLDDIRRIAARLIDPDALHFVVVGQPQGLD